VTFLSPSASETGNNVLPSGTDPAAHSGSPPEPLTMTDTPSLRPPEALRWPAWVWSAGVPIGATVVSQLLFPAREPANHLIVYLIGVVIVASRFGFWPSAAASLLSVAASDFLLMAPVFSFEVARPQDAVTLGVFLLAALAVSQLTANLRAQGERARQRELRVRFLYELTRSLADVRTESDVARIVAREVATELDWRCELRLVRGDGGLGPAGEAPGDESGAKPVAGNAGGDAEDDLVQWVFENRRAAGRGTGALAERRALAFPVSGASRRFGVLLLRPERPSLLLLPEQRRLLETVAAQVSQTIERIGLAREVQAATVQAQTEALRNSLLNAVAHDLRTPLASIVAAAGTLLQGKGLLSERQSRELTETILEEGQRMARLADNTLEMARLEAGSLRVEPDWYPLEEIVGAALSRLEDRLRGHCVGTRVPDGGALARLDLVMIVRVLENLVENAAKYAPAGSRIEVGAEAAAGEVRFTVTDEGPGLAPGDERRVFEKFYRGAAHGRVGGVGLGLTICRILVEAHGGAIAARNRPQGGAEFSFALPQHEAPPQLVAEDACTGQAT
jgi:two-component system sensor histidine kinase KdpD